MWAFKEGEGWDFRIYAGSIPLIWVKRELWNEQKNWRPSKRHNESRAYRRYVGWSRMIDATYKV